MDRGTPALIGWLALASVALIAVITVLIALFAKPETAEEGGIGGVAWRSLLRTLEAGTLEHDSGSPLFLALRLTVAIGGIFIVSSLIGVLTAGLEARIGELRKGRAPVTFGGHAVLLGWSDQVVTMITELVAANHGNRRGHVVVLAARDKVEMQDELRARVGDTGRLRVICRSGSPVKREDLELANLDAARSVTVLSEPDESADIDVVKTLLLLNNRAWSGRRPHIVAAVRQSHNLAAARLAGGPQTQVVDADDIAVRLVVKSHKQAGLSSVYADLLNFAGNEIYLHREPSLVGRTYGQALHAYAHGTPIALRHGDGTVEVNPPMDTVIAATDQIAVIAEDETLIRIATTPPRVASDHLVPGGPAGDPVSRTVLVGWNARGPKVLDLLDQISGPGSAVDVASADEPGEALNEPRTNIRVGHKVCEPTRRRSLERLGLAGYQHVIVLADDRVSPTQADDRTLVTLLHLRDIERRDGDLYTIVTEMHDDANREVAQITEADDFIVSSRLISLYMMQLAENPHLQPILSRLLDPEGAEVALRRATDYVTAGVDVSFATVVEAARRRGETAIGYRLARHANTAPGYGVVLNPAKDSTLAFAGADSLIVIAEP
jgi:voltage-gated potassium channel Kch